MNQDYRQHIKSELQKRMKVNSRYSLRLMASKIGIAASTLSDIINSKRTCSAETAEKMAIFFEMTPKETETFLALAKLDSVKDPKVKIKITESLKFQFDSRADFEQNLFEVISDWHHNAILALLKTKGTWNIKSISKKLGLTVLETETALSRLAEIKLVVKANEFYQTTIGNPIVSSALPNAALRKYHRQMLTKAIDSLVEQTPQEKIIRTEMLAFDSKDLKKVDDIIRECLSQISQVSQQGRNKDTVYHASVQFFKLNKQ